MVWTARGRMSAIASPHLCAHPPWPLRSSLHSVYQARLLLSLPVAYLIDLIDLFDSVSNPRSWLHALWASVVS